MTDTTLSTIHRSVAMLAPTIAERAGACERERRVPAETIAALVESGVLRGLQPQRWGGAEAHPLDFFEAISVLGAACASTAWVTSILGVHSWQLTLFGLEAQHDVWGDDPAVLISSSYAPTGRIEPVPGGYRVSGRWNFSSGVDHADWIFLGGIVPDGPVSWGGLPDIRTFLLPRRDFVVDDVWHTAGLAGTGSNDVVVDDAFVPEHRTLPFAQLITGDWAGREAEPPALYGLPFAAMFVNCLAAPAIGNAAGALERFRSRAEQKRAAARPGRDPLDPWLRTALADCVCELDAAVLTRRHDLAEMVDVVTSDGVLTLEQRARYRWHAARAVGRSAGILDVLFDNGGAHGIYLDEPDQRAFRDARVMAVHAYTHHQKSADVYSRVALGYDLKDYLL
jgi:3-hydroxy-9,10-secoandrosta-1,3,5(10)-triene-9,17-dione monooxygenase